MAYFKMLTIKHTLTENFINVSKHVANMRVNMDNITTYTCFITYLVFSSDTKPAKINRYRLDSRKNCCWGKPTLSPHSP